jgi:hypothetical protein
MCVDRLPQADCELGHLHRHRIALELHLAPREVERSDQLQVRGRRRVGEEGFLERALDMVKVFVPDEHHRALPE